MNATRIRPPVPVLLWSVLLLVLFAAAALAAGPPGGGGNPAVVTIVGTQGNWEMQVDGQPYYVKGISWGPDIASGTVDTYMADIASMGVNTIRTWGTGPESGILLDSAEAHGIKVMLGHWLQHHIDYADDMSYRDRTIREIKRRVNDYKDHPAVLCWNVGNEVILFNGNYFSGQELEDNRYAYGQFLEDLSNEIHAIDPNHPVTSTVAWTGAWDYIEPMAPSLDFHSVNSYGGIAYVSDGWIAANATKPYTVTEYGSEGEWEVDDDVNGYPTEPFDWEKRDDYTLAWNEITGHAGVALGGFAFIYGFQDDFGGIWLNTKADNGNLRRLSYYAVKESYTGPLSENQPPVVNSMTLTPQSNAPAGSTVQITVNVTDPDGDSLTYAVKQCSKYVNGNESVVNANYTQTGPGTFDLVAPSSPGVWKVYVYVYDGQGNVGIEPRSLGVVP